MRIAGINNQPSRQPGNSRSLQLYSSSLQRPRQEFRPVLMIIDGLDESEKDTTDGPTRKQVVRLFSSLWRSSSSNIFKILVLCRAEADITSTLESSLCIDMKDVNAEDIQKIVNVGVEKIYNCIIDGSSGQLDTRDFPGSRSDDIYERDLEGEQVDAKDYGLEGSSTTHELQFLIDYLLLNADGVILWVVLILRELLDVAQSGAFTIAQFEGLLSTIPKTLTELYVDILDRIRKTSFSNKPQAQYTFSWLIFARRTLRVSELRDALAMFHWEDNVPDLEPRFLQRHRIFQRGSSWQPMWRHLINICGGFLEIIPQNAKERESANMFQKDREVHPDDWVQLIHQTVKDFLLHESYDAEGAFLEPGPFTGNNVIVTACVEYLRLTLPPNLNLKASIEDSGFSSELSIWNIAAFIDLLEDLHLLEYCLDNIYKHIEANSPQDDFRVKKLYGYMDIIRKEPRCIPWAFLENSIPVLNLGLNPDENHSSTPIGNPTSPSMTSGIIIRATWHAREVHALNALRCIYTIHPGMKVQRDSTQCLNENWGETRPGLDLSVEHMIMIRDILRATGNGFVKQQPGNIKEVDELNYRELALYNYTDFPLLNSKD
jgi:hypothetical protein